MTAIALQEPLQINARGPSRESNAGADDRALARSAPSLLTGVQLRALQDLAPEETERSGDRYWHVWPLSLFRRDR